jgi:bifunctional non-homologous end joining protein LigD
MSGGGTERRFFIKLHSARRVHFDVRLEHDGVLKSWVIPEEGPCLDSRERRPAVSVADHEVKWGSLERVIPSGQYGAGPMLLWDHGIWLPNQDVDQALQNGHLTFHLHGSKLKGVWSLNRIPVRCGVRGKNWLLKKEEDAEAWPLSERNIVAEMPESVLTGRTLNEVAADPRRVVSLKQNSQEIARSKTNGSHQSQLSLPFDAPEP